MAPIILSPRQTITTASTTQCNNLSPGAIAGIVLGTIAGTLLILWLIMTVRSNSYTPRPEPARVKRRRRRSRVVENMGEKRVYVSDDARSHRVMREPSRVVYAK